MPRWVVSPDAFYARRTEAKLSQRELAERVGVTQGAVSMWETGTQPPALRTFFAVVRALDCKIEDLLIDLDADNEAPGGTSMPDESQRLGVRQTV
jgi:transcriptional regulator with XRE-family HTH domain